MQNQEDPMTRFREIGQNVNFWTKKGIFGPKGQTGFFGQNPKMSLPSH